MWQILKVPLLASKLSRSDYDDEVSKQVRFICTYKLSNIERNINKIGPKTKEGWCGDG